MSSLLFPALLGLGWDIVRTPIWDTGLQVALSGKTSTVQKRFYPTVHYELSFDVLRDTGAPGFPVSSASEVQQIVSLFNAVGGRFDTWLYNDPDFNTVVHQPFGTLTSGVLPYQLTATYAVVAGPYPGAPELIQNLNGTPTLYSASSTAGPWTLISSSNYSIGPTGIVTFTSGYVAANLGLVIGWSGSFYYRCRFDEDDLKNLKKHMKAIWVLDHLPFTSVKL